jgi:endonuclease/exonuclease/phosphatase family metal-dependent hydrolase
MTYPLLFLSHQRFAWALALLATIYTGCAPTRIAFQPSVPADCRRPGTEQVSWIGPETARDRALHDRWCAAVAPPEIAHAQVSQSQADLIDGSVRLAIVSWNMEVGGGTLVPLVDALRRGDFTGGERIAHFVLLLQEVYRHDPRLQLLPAGSSPPRAIGGASAEGDIVQLARTLGLELFYAPAMRNGHRQEDRGNAILSTEPISELSVIELPFERQRRIALMATAGGPGGQGPGRIRVGTAHFETRAGLTRRGPAEARRRQAEALAAIAGESELPVIVAGDLNTSWGDDEPAVKTLRGVLPDAGPTPGTTWSRGVMSAKLDHIFARLPDQKRLAVRKLPSRYGSDHYPLIVVMNP